jgi:tetratricopeptide (TPR) repeat protein
MKIKPAYLYISVFLIILLALVIFDSNSSKSSDTSNSSMPKDEVHKTIISNSKKEPSGSNVSSEVFNKMNILEKMVNENPNDTAKIKEYADFLTAAHKQDKAIELYNKILTKDYARIDILSRLSILFFNKNDFITSKNYIEKIIKIDPNNTEALYNFGVIEARTGNIANAKVQWENLTKKFPNTEMARKAMESLNQLKN